MATKAHMGCDFCTNLECGVVLKEPSESACQSNCNTMAKWGEGDPRWIVEERADGTNANNWHWKEKNATVWSKQTLKSLLVGFVRFCWGLLNKFFLPCSLSVVSFLRRLGSP
jgi:hypothetical protein